MTKQEIFNKVAKHLLTQMKRSYILSLCSYRGSDGTKCAVGCLISDADYQPRMDYSNLPVSILLTDYNELPSIKVLTPYEDMLGSLQRIHDIIMPNEWKKSLIEYAKKYQLDYSSI